MGDEDQRRVPGVCPPPPPKRKPIAKTEAAVKRQVRTPGVCPPPGRKPKVKTKPAKKR
jgi:hypothetical protein